MEACLTGMSTFQVSTKHGVRSRRLQSYAWEVRKYPGSSHEQNGTDADACITWLSELLLRRPSRMQPRPGMQCATRHVVACGRTRGLQPPQVCTAPTCCGCGGVVFCLHCGGTHTGAGGMRGLLPKPCPKRVAPGSVDRLSRLKQGWLPRGLTEWPDAAAQPADQRAVRPVLSKVVLLERRV